jgi:short-subunit dehydrogenase
MLDLHGAVVVVSGASSGLGRRFAVDLAREGAVVIGVARRQELLKAVADEMQQASPRSTTVTCDVTDTDRYATVLTDIQHDNGRIDVLINNAGIGEPGPEPSSPLTPYRTVMETNYFAAVAGTLAVLPGMVQRGRGVVVNVSSDAGRTPTGREVAYGASKAALSSFSESISYAAERHGVHIHVLYPGWVPTAMGNGSLENGLRTPPRPVRRSEQQVSRLLLARMGRSKLDIDATRIARLAPVARTFAPSLYRRAVRKVAGLAGR